MDFGGLIIVVGVGATVDALADVEQHKTVVPAMLAAAFLLVILACIGQVTGQWGFATALGFLYLLASVFRNYKHVPALSGLFTTTKGN